MSSFAVKLQRFIDDYIGAILCFLLWPFTPRPHEIGTPKRIIFVKLWAVGESVLILPLIKAVKERYPQAEVSVFTRARNAGTFTEMPEIDQVLILEKGGLKGGFRKYDITFDCEPFFKISALISFFLGKQTVGFDHGIRSKMYTYKSHYNDNQHVVRTYLDLLNTIGAPAPVPTHLVPLSYSATDAKKAEEYLEKEGISSKDTLIGFCATSAESAHSRLWAPERFAEVADHLIRQYGAKVIFVGTAVDVGYNQDIIDRMQEKDRAINAAGKTNLKQLFAMVKHCKIFISNDTGPMHIAAAQGVPTIGLFCPNTPIRFAPYGPKNISIYKPVLPKPCINVHTGKIPNCATHQHMSKITVDDVYQAATTLLTA